MQMYTCLISIHHVYKHVSVDSIDYGTTGKGDYFLSDFDLCTQCGSFVIPLF